jgi:hypothetical protein
MCPPRFLAPFAGRQNIGGAANKSLAAIYLAQNGLGKLDEDGAAAGERTANWPVADILEQAKTALQQFGTYDFQQDKATNTWFSEYVHAANYAVGVYMAGAGYGLYQSLAFAQA